MLGNADKVAWKFLIEKGSVTDGWSFYGGMFERCPNKTKECVKKVKDVGIDWDKTKAPEGDSESVFAGTFAEESDWIETLEGTLCLKDGSEYKWGATDVSASDVVKFIVDKYMPDPFEV